MCVWRGPWCRLRLVDGSDRWVNGWVDGWMGGWVGGWIDEWMDGCTWNNACMHRWALNRVMDGKVGG